MGLACKPPHLSSVTVLALCLTVGLHSPSGGVLAAEQLAGPAQGATVKPFDWLRAQPAPEFAPGSTLPPLTRWGWCTSFEVAKELADRWGYAVEFANYVSEAVTDEALANPAGRNGQCLALVASSPQRYKLGVLLDRQFPRDMPPEAYIRGNCSGSHCPCGRWSSRPRLSAAARSGPADRTYLGVSRAGSARRSGVSGYLSSYHPHG